jgi:LPS sulfotransferase NodH
VIIATIERSGSNYLSELMRATDRMGWPNEFFSPYVLAEQFALNDVSAGESCQIAAEYASSDGTVGIKLFPAQFATLQKTVRLSEWFGTPLWIWLRRRDILGQAISFTLALQRGTFVSYYPASRAAEYAPQKVNAMLRAVAEREAQWRAYFGRNGIQPLELWYEDVEADPRAALRAVARYIGVDEEQAMAATQSRFERQRTEINEVWRERFYRDCAEPDRFAPDPPVPTLRRRIARRLLGR